MKKYLSPRLQPQPIGGEAQALVPLPTLSTLGAGRSAAHCLCPLSQLLDV